MVAEAGIEALNQVWRAPEALPTLAELEQPPSGWLPGARADARLSPGADPACNPPHRAGLQTCVRVDRLEQPYK